MGKRLKGRYLMAECLKASSGIATYRAVDTQGDHGEIVIKCCISTDVSPALQMRLEHEAAILAGLDWDESADAGRPAILGWGEDQGLTFLVMPYVKGVGLDVRVRHKVLTTDETLALGVAVARHLIKVHTQGILHRDIKPSNIVVNPHGPLQRATLVDFGLARSTNFSSVVGEARVFTALYTSPEQAGLIDHGIDERSDLYALGIVLYEALAGHPPFQGEDLQTVLLQHLSAEVPRLHRSQSDVPGVLADLIQRLLAKDPRDRYQSASSLLHDLTSLVKARASGHPSKLILGQWDRRAALTEPSFVGRHNELNRLRDFVSLAKLGGGGLMLLEAPSGAGKSRLLSELALQSQSKHHIVLRAQGQSRSAERPYDALGVLLRAALQAARFNPAYATHLRQALRGHAAPLQTLLPELAGFLFGQKAPQDGALARASLTWEEPEVFAERRKERQGVASLTACLMALGYSEQPALIILDDCQWVDAMTLSVLSEWSQTVANKGRSCHTALIAAFRSDEVTAHHPLRSLRAREHLALGPLRRKELGELLTSMAGPLPADVLNSILEVAQNNPFMATAVLHGLVENGALYPREDGWGVAPQRLAGLQSSRRAAAILLLRLDALPAQVLGILRIGALLGKTFDRTLVTMMAGLQAGDVLAALTLAKRRQIIWEEASEGRYRFVHDKLRDALAEGLSPDDCQRLHRLAAEYSETYNSDHDFEIAYHFDAAGLSARAYPYAVRAAAQAREQGALALAEKQYRIALRGLSSAASAAEALRLARGLGETLIMQGRYEEAREQLEAARGFTSTKLELATIAALLGELGFKSGNMPYAHDAICKGLLLLDYPVPQRTMRLVAQTCSAFLRQTLHSLFPRALQRYAKHREVDEGTALRLHLYMRIGYAYWALGGQFKCAWAHLRHLNLAEAYAESGPLATAYACHGPATMTIPWFSRGLAYTDRALSIRRKIGEALPHGQALNFRACLCYAASRFEECITNATQALEILETAGDHWEINFAQCNLAYAHYRLGRLEACARIVVQVYDKAVASGDYATAGTLLNLWAMTTHGHIPRQVLVAEAKRGLDNAMTQAALTFARGLRLLLAKGQAVAASKVLAAAQAVVDQAKLRQEYVAPILPWLVTALRCAAESFDRRDPRHQGYLTAAQTKFSLALKLARRFRNNLPHTLREGAYLASWQGQVAKAQRLLAASLEEARRQGARYEEALSLRAQGQLGAFYGWPGSEQAAASGQQLQQELAYKPEAPRPAIEDHRRELSLAARFDALLEVGRHIVSQLDEARLYQNLLEAAHKLFYSHHCVIVGPPGGKERLAVIAGDAGLELSRSLLAEAQRQGGAVAVDELAAASPHESLVLARVRSALCVPVRKGEAVVAFLYVAHAAVGRVFQHSEVRIAHYLAVLAGAALENAEGFAKLQELNRCLEGETAERKKTAVALQEAKNRAEAANRVKSEFLANMSHEMRTPLSTMLGYIHLLRDHTPPCAGDPYSPETEDLLTNEERERFITIIERNGQQLMQLINNILDLSQMETRVLKVEPQALTLAELLRALHLQVAASAQAKGLALSFDVADDVPATIVSDPLRLQQALLNMLGNAIKFTAQGQVRLTVSTEPRPPLCSDPLANGQAALLVFTICDTGCGIPCELQARLFKPFVQADSSPTRHFGGSGLGLALTRKLARALGGEVKLRQSIPGQGAAFALYLPQQLTNIRRTLRPLGRLQTEGRAAPSL